MSAPTRSGIGAFIMGCIAFLFACLIIMYFQGCQTWSVTVEREIDFKQVNQDIPLQFQAGIGGKF